MFFKLTSTNGSHDGSEVPSLWNWGQVFGIACPVGSGAARVLSLCQCLTSGRGPRQEEGLGLSFGGCPSPPHPGAPSFWMTAPRLGLPPAWRVAGVWFLVLDNLHGWAGFPFLHSARFLVYYSHNRVLLIEFIFVWIALVVAVWIFIQVHSSFAKFVHNPTLRKRKAYFPLRVSATVLGHACRVSCAHLMLAPLIPWEYWSTDRHQ